ncbi:MAG: uroporphyrinogen decarboxylase family protein [Christensenellales bacterium]|jgi:hypothetical protein
MQNIRQDLAEVIGRAQAFHQSDAPGQALIKIRGIAAHRVPQPKLTDYVFPQDTHRYLDDCYAAQVAVWNPRLALPDDQIAYLGPWYGIAEHSAFLGGEVSYAEDTSWHHQLMDDPGELDKISLDENNDIYRMVVGGIAYIKERYGDTFLPRVRGISGPLDVINMLRGNDFFYDLMDEPEAVDALLERCTDLIIEYYNRQLDAAGLVMGGSLTGFGEWLPGRSVGHMSEDATTMLSVAQFERFGRPHTARICQAFDHAMMHTHALGERCLPSIASIPHLTLMEISNDPNADRAIEVYRRTKDNLSGVVPILPLNAQEIRDHLELLKQIKSVLWYEAQTLEEAQEICAFVRRELPVT